MEAGGTLGETESLALLRDYGLGVPAHRLVASEDELCAAARSLGYPVVLKTAATGVHHKSDVGGVHLGIPDEEALLPAYRDMATQLGPSALVAAMAPGGVEMALGLSRDPQFGPLVMVAGGGIFIELLRDRAYALPPVDGDAARRMIDRLTIRPLLDGLRGAPPSDIDSLVDALARFSVLAADLGDLIAEADVNPLIVSPQGCVAVDGLVIPVASGEGTSSGS